MTENKRFYLDENGINDREYEFSILGEDELVDIINDLNDEYEQLKKEKEFWKSDACSLLSLNSILSNELSIAQEQGYEPSIPYKEYITSRQIERLIK